MLLPLAVLCVAASGIIDLWLSRSRTAVQLLVWSAALVAIVATNVVTARKIGVFDLHVQESRYRLAAAFIGDHASQPLVLFAAQHSGALTAYTGLDIIRVDRLRPEEFHPVVRWMHARGRHVALVLDEEERRELTSRMPGVELLGFNWPARALVGAPVRTRVWFLGDLEALRAGNPVTTVRLHPRRR